MSTKYIHDLKTYFELNQSKLQPLWTKILRDLEQRNTFQLLLDLEMLLQTIRPGFDAILESHTSEIGADDYYNVFQTLLSFLTIQNPTIEKQQQREIIAELTRLFNLLTQERQSIHDAFPLKDSHYFDVLYLFMPRLIDKVISAYNVSANEIDEISASIINPDRTESKRQTKTQKAMQKYLDKRRKDSKKLQSLLEKFGKKFTQIVKNNQSFWNRYRDHTLPEELLNKVKNILSNKKTSILEKLSKLLEMEKDPTVQQHRRLHRLLLNLMIQLPDDIRKNGTRSRVYHTKPYIIQSTSTKKILGRMGQKPSLTVEEVFSDKPTTPLSRFWRRLTGGNDKQQTVIGTQPRTRRSIIGF